jgi:hypothetical protein
VAAANQATVRLEFESLAGRPDGFFVIALYRDSRAKEQAHKPRAYTRRRQFEQAEEQVSCQFFKHVRAIFSRGEIVIQHRVSPG